MTRQTTCISGCRPGILINKRFIKATAKNLAGCKGPWSTTRNFNEEAFLGRLIDRADYICFWSPTRNFNKRMTGQTTCISGRQPENQINKRFKTTATNLADYEGLWSKTRNFNEEAFQSKRIDRAAYICFWSPTGN